MTKNTHHSAAKVSKTPQVDHHGLSYAGQHLLLILQHQIDIQKIKVSSSDASWERLKDLNKDIDLVDQKDHIKKICNIHHFSPLELNEIASRITKFVTMYQPNMVEK